MKKYNKNIILVSFLLAFCFIIALTSYLVGKRSTNNNDLKTDIKTSEKQVKTYKKELDSLQTGYSRLEKKKQEVKTVYIQGKEKIRYITQERIEKYQDSLCKEDVLTLKDQLTQADSLILFQDKQLISANEQIKISNNLITEKDYQINTLKSVKPKTKPLGIGIIGGYGTDFQNGLTPFIGIGINYNLIRL